MARKKEKPVAFSVTSGVADYQVYQRNLFNIATLKLEGKAGAKGTVYARLLHQGKPVAGFESLEVAVTTRGKWEGEIASVPTGGPYTLELSLVDAAQQVLAKTAFHHLLVGDLWLLAGQSNMQGVGNLKDASQPVTPPHPLVNVFRMRHLWDEAREPLHRLWESQDIVHRTPYGEAFKEVPSLEASDRFTGEQIKGAGCGLPFAAYLADKTGVPQGLVPVAHGGTSMAQWNPDLRTEGGKSLYGSLLHTLKAVGGKVAGVLWYQGESDAQAEAAKVFRANCHKLVEALRKDCGDPALPFYYVQIGCFAITETPEGAKYWCEIREIQRTDEAEIPNSKVVSVIDLPLDDLIHVSTSGHQRLGKRLAKLACGEIATGPRLARLERTNEYIKVVFSGVTGSLLPKDHIAGFSLRDPEGKDLNLIYRAKVDPNDSSAVLLGVQPDLPVPDDAKLWYGYGFNPYCNLTDEADMGVLAMGPLDLPPLKK